MDDWLREAFVLTSKRLQEAFIAIIKRDCEIFGNMKKGIVIHPAGDKLGYHLATEKMLCPFCKQGDINNG